MRPAALAGRRKRHVKVEKSVAHDTWEALSEPGDAVEAEVPQTPLHGADVRPVHPSPLGEFLLGQVEPVTELADALAECLAVVVHDTDRGQKPAQKP